MSVPLRQGPRRINPVSSPLVADAPPLFTIGLSSPLVTPSDVPAASSPGMFPSECVGVGVGRAAKKEKAPPASQSPYSTKIDDSLLCVDFLPAFNALAIGCTRSVRILEVTEQATSQPRAGAPMAFRDCGMFGNVAKIESLAWYPAADEATLAIVQLSRNVTILLDCLALKGGSGDYMAQQWIRNAHGRSVASAVPVGNGLLNSAYLGNIFSVPSTPGVVQQQQNPPIDAHAADSVPTAKRTAPGAPRAMIEVSIDTSYTCVERIAWDPHNPYTLALTTDTTHFELWTVPVIANTVYPPKLVLRPPAHNEQATTRGVAFSPSDPHLIIVVVEVANAGQVIVYDRRQVEVPRRLATTGPCITLAFHPTYCDLLAVCYIKKKTLRDSRVQFFRVLDETSTPHRDIRPPVVEQHVIPPIDTFDPLHPIRWRPSISRFSGFSPDTEASHNSATLISAINDNNGYGTASINNSSSSIVDTISSQMWFATGVQNNAQDIDIWDAANGFCPIFSLRGSRDNCKKKDCVWISPLSLVSIFMGGEVVLTSLLDDSAEGRDTLFRLPGGSAEMKDMDVFNLSAILPTAAVVSDYFGRSFVARNTSSQLREYYTRVVRAESCEWVEQLAARRTRLAAAKSILMNRGNPTAAAATMLLESTTGTPIRGYGAGSALLSPHQRSLQATHSPHPALNSVTSFASSVVSSSSVKGHQTPMVSKPAKEWGIKNVMKFFSSSSEKTQEANVAKQQQKKASSRTQGTASATPTPSSAAMVVDTMCTPLLNSEFLTCDKTQLTVLVTAPRGSSDTAFEFVFPTLLLLASKEVATVTTIPEISRAGAVVTNSRAIDIASPVSDIALHTFNSLDERQWQLSSSTLRTAACSLGAQQKILLSPLEGHFIESSNSSGRNHVPYFGSCQTIMRSPASPTPSEEDNMCRRPVGLRSVARKVNQSALGLPNIWKNMPTVTNHASPVVSRGSVVETSSTFTSLPAPAATTAANTPAAVTHPVFPSSPYALHHRRIDDEGFRAPKACETEWESRTGLLGARSRVSPVIERFGLSDETCGWAYVERGAEGEAFVLYAREWQVGYETARQMHNARRNDPDSDDNNSINDDDDNDNDNDGIAYGTSANAGNHAQTVCEAMSVMEAHHVDRRFARMAEHNARVCEAHERDLLEYNSRCHRLHNTMSLNTYHHHMNFNSSSYCNSSNAAVDPRAQLWAAVAHALRSHDVSLVTTLVTSQLDYVSLLGDAQYCIVLYLLYGLWWRKRHCCMRCHPCPLVPHGNDDHNKKNNNNKSCSSHPHCTRGDPVDSDGTRKAAAAGSLETARRRWWLRALQWLEQYVTWLHACGLHVALNELLLIVPHVTGEPFNPVHPRAADIRYKKQLTSVCCGMCRNAALVPCAMAQAAMSAASKSTNSDSPKLRAVEWDRGDAWGSEDDDDDDDDESGCMFSDSFSSATTTVAPAASTSSTPMNNASCRLCNSRAHMVCVICEEIVEGVYFSLRGCGHGGHVHHIEEWLRLSNECPRCGETIQSQSVAQATV